MNVRCPELPEDADIPFSTDVPGGHQGDEDGEHHPDECYACLLGREPPTSACRCGACCRLIIEVELEDAQREPKIKELGSPIVMPAELTESGEPELAGYLLNWPPSYACVFLDERNCCSIYDTRPLVCRLFDCDEARSERLIDLGLLPREKPTIRLGHESREDADA